MSDFLEAVRRAAATLSIANPARFSVFGEEYSATRADEAPEPGSLLAPSCRRALTHALYERLHCRPSDDVPGTAEEMRDERGAAQFAKELSRANAGTGRWERADRARHDLRQKRWIVEHMAVRFHASRSEVRAKRAGRSAQFLMAKEKLAVFPGFYLAHANKSAARQTAPLVRLYWHIDSAGAPVLLRQLTTRLNRASVDFQVKVLHDPLDYPRTDAVVVYLEGHAYRGSLRALRSTYDAVARYIYPGVSFVVKRLALGRGLAADPPGGPSFGEHRADVVARALANPLVTQAPDVAHFVVEQLSQNGLDPLRLYLNPGSTDAYDWAD